MATAILINRELKIGMRERYARLILMIWGQYLINLLSKPSRIAKLPILEKTARPVPDRCTVRHVTETIQKRFIVAGVLLLPLIAISCVTHLEMMRLFIIIRR